MQLPFQIDLTGQVAVVTGGSGVIGGIFARALGKCGAKVAVLGRKVENGIPVVKDIEAEGGEAVFVAANVLEKESLKAAKQEILDKWGKINILVNCAGGAVKSAQIPQDQFSDFTGDMLNFFTTDMENVKRELDLNLYGTMLPTQIFGESMVGQENANIINISSMGAYGPLTRIPGYSGAKAAVSNFTEWAATYFAKSGIRVNAIAPGFFQTPQNYALHFHEDGTPTHRSQKIIDSTPMGKYGDPEDLIGALLFLVSPKGSSFVTGVVLPVDGGFHCYLGV
ncbi:MAG: SDR family oxidoreductase [Lachnospiraceae bacterium]|nr:SDR family oxidoreductase [Lachnospiraceae bacterium]MCI7190755.1 SDR family oxidoreductase [Lachnospiraceae bacterium]MDD7627133.1 SDR family oxidoreductase [Lachnospiraceae bacterium]MDY4118423.1 SDR family oxidoreductase [Lachnospiraceae bacterium]